MVAEPRGWLQSVARALCCRRRAASAAARRWVQLSRQLGNRSVRAERNWRRVVKKVRRVRILQWKWSHLGAFLKTIHSNLRDRLILKWDKTE